jgi:hypothetical protein
MLPPGNWSAIFTEKRLKTARQQLTNLGPRHWPAVRRHVGLRAQGLDPFRHPLTQRGTTQPLSKGARKDEERVAICLGLLEKGTKELTALGRHLAKLCQTHFFDGECTAAEERFLRDQLIPRYMPLQLLEEVMVELRKQNIQPHSRTIIRLFNHFAETRLLNEARFTTLNDILVRAAPPPPSSSFSLS